MIILFAASLLVASSSPRPDWTHFTLRNEFSKSVRQIHVGDESDVVRKKLGEPSSILSASGQGFTNPNTGQMWLYSDTVASSFPSLGTIIFDRRGRVARTVGGAAPSEELKGLASKVPLSALEDELHSCVGLIARHFHPSKIIQVCRKLKRLGFYSAVTVLREYSRMRPVDTPLLYNGAALITQPYVDGNDGRLGIVIKTLMLDDGFEKSEIFPFDWYVGYYESFFKDPDLTQPVEFVGGWPVVLPQGIHLTRGQETELALLDQASSVGTFKSKNMPSKPSEQSITRFLAKLKLNCNDIRTYEFYERIVRQQLSR